MPRAAGMSLIGWHRCCIEQLMRAGENLPSEQLALPHDAFLYAFISSVAARSRLPSSDFNQDPP